MPALGADYAQYAAARDALALQQSALLPLRTLATPPGDAREWGLHPSLAKVQTCFMAAGRPGRQRGPLVAPLTPRGVLARTAAVPPQLFCHSDQTVHLADLAANQPARTGWGGRTAACCNRSNENARSRVHLVAGTNTFQVGNVVTQYQCRRRAWA